MKEMIKIKLISEADQKASNCIDYGDIIRTVENAFKEYHNGEIILPEKISQIFNEENQSRINCMPSTLLNDRVCGVKWVSVFPDNPTVFGTQNVSGIIILSEIEKGYPFAIMDATLITALRTACMGAIGATYFARKDSTIYGTIGAGAQAETHFRFIKEIFPKIDTCKIASRKASSEKSFIDALAPDYPDVEFIGCNADYNAAISDADIIVTAVSCQQPLLRADYIKKGSYYCHVGGWEDDYDVPLMADKIVCDDWDALKHRGSPTIARLYKMGKLKDEDIYANLAEIITNEKCARESAEEFVYFNAIGLSFVDIAVAYSFYNKAINNGNYEEWTL